MSIQATFMSGTRFTVEQDQTHLFTTDRLVRGNCGIDGYKYACIESSSYDGTLTTVVIGGGDSFTSRLVEVVVGIQQSGLTGSVPRHNHSSVFGQGGNINYVSTDASTDIVGNQNIDGTLTVTGSGANKRIVQVGSGEGALRFWHDNTGGEAKIHIEPYYLGEWNEDVEYSFDANTGEWYLQGNILRAPEVYYADPSVNDQGGTATGSFKNIVTALDTDSNATIIFPSTDGLTEYEFNKSFDCSAWQSLNFEWEEGAVFTQKTGDETVTFYSAVQLQFTERRTIGPVDMFVFDQDIMKYGQVDVFPWVSADVSNVRLPSGLWADISGDVGTQGIQTAIDYSIGSSDGYNLYIIGRHEPDLGAIIFNCTETIQVPPVRGTVWKTGSIEIRSSASPVIQFDTFGRCLVELNADIIGMADDAPVILIKPASLDLMPYMGNEMRTSYLRFSRVSSEGNFTSWDINNSLVVFDASDGYIAANTFDFQEFNGLTKENLTGLAIIGADYWVYNNVINCPQFIRFSSEVPVLIMGQDGVENDWCRNNVLNVGMYNWHDPIVGTGIKCNAKYTTINMFGNFDDLYYGKYLGYTTEIYWGQYAEGNLAICPKITKVIDDSDGSNKIVSSPTIPTKPYSTGVKGETCRDDTYAYFCVDTDTWKRVPLETWTTTTTTTSSSTTTTTTTP